MMQTAQRLDHIGESVIREMTRLAMQHDAINLSQGFPEYPTPPELLEAAIAAIRQGENQYTVTWGYPALRRRLAERYTERLGWEVDPDVHVTVTCGVTEAIVAACLAILNPGDEVLIIEPAHENFRPAVVYAGGKPVPVPLSRPGYRLDLDRLAAAITPRTRALILNTPHNPSGRVFDEAELTGVMNLVVDHDLTLVTDEIYEHILFDGRQHVSPGSLEPLRDRTITIAGFGKTYAVTGWRLGYAIAPGRLALAVRTVHDFLTICAPTPLQAAAVAAFDLPAVYYETMMAVYHQRRALIMEILTSWVSRPPYPKAPTMSSPTSLVYLSLRLVSAPMPLPAGWSLPPAWPLCRARTSTLTRLTANTPSASPFPNGPRHWRKRLTASPN